MHITKVCVHNTSTALKLHVLTSLHAAPTDRLFYITTLLQGFTI